MKKTLYLHIGTPKTATTAIQMFCEANQAVLNKKGYDYPILPFKYPRIRIERNAHFLVGRIWTDGVRDPEREKELRDQGFAMVEESFKQYDHVILSDENIWHSTASYAFNSWKVLKKFVDDHGYDLKVIVYLRRQDTLLTSWLNQQVQDGWNRASTLTWEEYIKKPVGVVIDYYSHLEKISEIIGKENIVVRIFERNRFEGNGNTIQSDFLKIIGLEMTDEFFVSDKRDNITLSLNACEVKRIVNTVPDSDSTVHQFTKTITEKVAESYTSPFKSEWFSKEERLEFLETCRESNEKIAREYLHREDGQLFNMDIKEAEKWTPHNPYIYEDVIRFFAETVLTQQKELIELRKELALKAEKKDSKEQMKELKRELKEERREGDRKLRERIYDLEQTALLFRLRRKWRHITGQDKKEESAQ